MSLSDRPSFEALILDGDPKEVPATVRRLEFRDLPSDGNVVIRITASSLNFKDALAVTGDGKVVRAPYPFVPGIDLVGEIVESSSDRFAAGEVVVGTGGGLGETRWGGYSSFQRLPDDWLVRLPSSMSAGAAMAVGTAGLTAMLSLIQMERLGSTPDGGPVVVTGATGGVGSLAVLLFSTAGYEVIASTGKSEAQAYLRRLGAQSVIDRSVLGRGAARPLDSARWAGAVDTVGGPALEAIISQTARHGCIAVCGLADGPAVNTSVYPLILRGVSLLGIDSNTCPPALREAAWERLSEMIDYGQLGELTETIGLGDVPERARLMLDGRITGRTVVRIREA